MSDDSVADEVNKQHQIVDDTGKPTTQLEEEKNTAASQLSHAPSKNGEVGMEVKVHSPFRTYYEGMAFSISGENATGPFDILPQHHNFISLLNPCELVVRSPEGDEKIQIAGGIMHVRADKVIVFLDV